MGHVPPGPFREAGQGHDVPRREHRRARADHPALSPRDVGAFGESVAAAFLADRGARVIARNQSVGRGEIDLIVDYAGFRIAVEVKTATATSRVPDPGVNFDDAKLAQVWRLARRLDRPADRVDLVTVVLGTRGVDVRWMPAVG